MSLSTNKNRKLFYSIAEVAERFNVNQSLLRFWEKEFPQIAPKTNKRGVRMYREEDIELIGMIYNLVKEKGMTISGARQRLVNEHKSVHQRYDVTTRLRIVRDELLAIKKELDQLSVSDSSETEVES